MQGFVPPDPQTEVSEEYWALVYMPGRNRQRYPANCVQIVDSAKAARADALLPGGVVITRVICRGEVDPHA
jgi:hypothetical protein